MLRRLGAVLALSALALLAFAPPAWAHVEIEPEEAVAGSTATLTFNVEYEGATTMGLEVQLPDGASVAEVPDKEGWTPTVDDTANTVAWSGGSASDDETFTVDIVLPTTTGEVLFPAIVQTADGEEAWIEPEESEGEEGHPAPRITLTAGEGSSSTTSTTEATTTTEDQLPGTTLEAEQRDDGSTSAAPWLIGSAIVAVLAIAIGGTILKRRSDAADKADASGDGADDAGSGDDS